jgi:hypothetical protein
MSAEILTITTAGLSECISASEAGLSARITHVSIGDVAHTPTPNLQRLINERLRSEVTQSVDLDGNTIQLSAVFTGPEEFPIREIGFWLESGTLLAIVSEPNRNLNFKARNAAAIQPFTLDLSVLPQDSVQVVVGTENLNVLITQEMASIGAAVIGSYVNQLDLKKRIIKLEQN